MGTLLRSFRSHLSAGCTDTRRCVRAVIFFAFFLTYACVLGSSQAPVTTTISGTVYDPRGASGLPLPNVLVYAWNSTATTPAQPAPVPTTGAQCLTFANQIPTGPNVVSYTYTATEGTFTLPLPNIPVGASITIVIQAGKWQSQSSYTVGTDPPAGNVLSMPANHTQGNIPLIAIVTGDADGAECVLHDMGIANSEFTDDVQVATGNPGRIHLYRGGGSPGAEMSASTPTETVLTQDSTLLNGYDMVMFPCQGGQYTTALSHGSQENIVDYANAGGRLFTTHFSYVYLDSSLFPATSSEAQYNAQFLPVANWDPQQIDPTPDPGIATVQTNFSDGAILAQWLENSGATDPNSATQVQISTLRHDFDGVIAPTQSWLVLNDASAGNPVMQMTFNAPVGAPAANQCGRVMYNEYHVYNQSLPKSPSTVFPSECPTAAPTSAQLAQREMLEYALFDLSGFVQPVVNPTLDVTFNPSPLTVKSDDNGDQLVVNVTNTSTTTETDSSAVLSFTLPSQLTITAMNDSSGGWICTVATASCTRNSSLPASTTDSVMLTLSVASYTTLSSYTGTITATVSSVTFSTNPSFTDTVIFQQPPAITWATPAPIVYGTALSGVQLDATSTVAGSFTYSPSPGTVLSTGQHTLTATFTPTDTTDYTTGTANVTLMVNPATPVVTLTSFANPVFLTTSVSFEAVIQSLGTVPTGTMVFYDGTAQLGSMTVNSGSATFTTTALAAGSHSVTAAYSGDSSYGSANSNALTEIIQDFTIAPSSGSGSITVSAGGLAVYSMVITPIDGPTLPGAVNLSVTGVPPEATVALTPAIISANSPATGFTIQVKMPGQLTADGRRHTPFYPGSLPVALGLVLLPFARRLRKARSAWYRVAVLALAGVSLAAALSGCGGSLNPQSFTFTVSGASASGSLSHSTTVNLTVQ